MAFFIVSIALGILILVLLMFTVYMYIKPVIAVSTLITPLWCQGTAYNLGIMGE